MEYVCVHTQVVHALILIHDTSVWTHELYLAMRNTEYKVASSNFFTVHK